MSVLDLDFSRVEIVGQEPKAEGEGAVTEMVTPEPEPEPEPIIETTEEPTPDPEPAPEPEPIPEPVVEASQESPDEVFNRLFKERTGYDSPEALRQQLKPQEPELSDTVKKLIDWEKKGLKPEDYFKTQTLDFNAMSDLDKVRNLWAIENPKLTPQQIELKLKKKFTLDPDVYEEEDVEYAKIELMEEADRALPKLQEWQVKAATPPVDNAAQEAQAQVQAYQDLVTEQLKDFSSIEIPISDKGEKLTYAIGEDKGKLEGMVKDVNTFFADYVATDAQGKQHFKVKEMARDLYLAKNWTKVAKAIAAQAKSKGVAQVEQLINNAPDPVKQEKPAADDNSSMARLGKLAMAGKI